MKGSVALLCLVGTFIPATAIRAQTPPPSVSGTVTRPCAGDTVTAIDVIAHPPSPISALERVSRDASEAVRESFATTRRNVILAYLRVSPGRVCTEFDQIESERALRAQPFIASAVVRAFPAGPGRVRIQVDVVDELPIVVGGSMRGGKFASATLGTLSLLGSGVALSVEGTRGFAYRTGFGIHIAQYGAFGGPFVLSADAVRLRLGEEFGLEFAAPFVTDLQRRAFRVGVSHLSGYFGVMGPSGIDVSLETRRLAYDVGWVARIGKLDRYHTAGFIGAALLGEAIHVGRAPTIVTDTGLVRIANVTLSDYPGIERLHLAAIAGLRSVRFLTVSGFDALYASQDVGVGVQMHALAGPSLWPADGRGEFFSAADAYAGVGKETSFFSAHVAGESRGDLGSPVWKGMVSSARLSWYLRPSRVRTRVLSVNGAAVYKLDFPAQLTLRDLDGGVAGFRDSRTAGGFRAVARVEERRMIGFLRPRADFAVAAFAEGGKLWAGDVPYGQTSDVRRSLGVSLLAAYPAGAKRTYRLDVAFPLNPERGAARVELRVSAFDRTRMLSVEPRDVSRLRTGAVPNSLMKW